MVLLCGLLVVSPLRAQDVVLLVAPEFPPLTYMQDNELRGIGIDRMHQVMVRAGLDYEVEHAQNYARAARLVANHQKDGFFMATQNAQRDSFAVFLTPFYVNRWNWFLPADSPLDPRDPDQRQTIRAASVVGTNTAKWLKQNGYSFGLSPRNVELLLTMLDARKVDAILLSEPVFNYALERTGREASGYRSYREVALPMGLYLSKKFAERHPETVRRIDQAIRELLPGWPR